MQTIVEYIVLGIRKPLHQLTDALRQLTDQLQIVLVKVANNQPTEAGRLFEIAATAWEAATELPVGKERCYVAPLVDDTFPSWAVSMARPCPMLSMPLQTDAQPHNGTDCGLVVDMHWMRAHANLPLGLVESGNSRPHNQSINRPTSSPSVSSPFAIRSPIQYDRIRSIEAFGGSSDSLPSSISSRDSSDSRITGNSTANSSSDSGSEHYLEWEDLWKDKEPPRSKPQAAAMSRPQHRHQHRHQSHQHQHHEANHLPAQSHRALQATQGPQPGRFSQATQGPQPGRFSQSQGPQPGRFSQATQRPQPGRFSQSAVDSFFMNCSLGQGTAVDSLLEANDEHRQHVDHGDTAAHHVYASGCTSMDLLHHRTRFEGYHALQPTSTGCMGTVRTGMPLKRSVLLLGTPQPSSPAPLTPLTSSPSKPQDAGNDLDFALRRANDVDNLDDALQYAIQDDISPSKVARAVIWFETRIPSPVSTN
jgi:hypothetical protein